jgi:hypothetical protein
MNQVLPIIITGIVILGLIGTPTPTTTVLLDLYATKSLTKQSPEPSDDDTVQPERQSQQPSESSGSTIVRPERQLQFNPEQQEDDGNGNEAAIEEKDEQFRDVLQEDDDNANDEEEEILDERIEIDKKAPIAISDDNIYIVWFNDRNTPNNNSEVLFRSSNDSGATFSDKINLSNTTDADSVDAKISAEGNNVIITWWEQNETSNEPVVRMSSDNGATFGPLLILATNGTIGQAAAAEE